jgi:protein-tyrosine phosphatase
VNYDYILAMDEANVQDIQSIVGFDTEGRIFRLLDFTDNPRNIRDPWYTGNFEETYQDVVEGCEAFLDYLEVWKKDVCLRTDFDKL